jgi:hypothetical protein
MHNLETVNNTDVDVVCDSFDMYLHILILIREEEEEKQHSKRTRTLVNIKRVDHCQQSIDLFIDMIMFIIREGKRPGHVTIQLTFPWRIVDIFRMFPSSLFTYLIACFNTYDNESIIEIRSEKVDLHLTRNIGEYPNGIRRTKHIVVFNQQSTESCWIIVVHLYFPSSLHAC